VTVVDTEVVVVPEYEDVSVITVAPEQLASVLEVL
jgi:hypothetical protein